MVQDSKFRQGQHRASPTIRPPQVHCGLEMPLLLVARDTAGSKRTSGGDAFEVSLESEAGQAVGSARVVDRGTGVYECFYRCVFREWAAMQQGEAAGSTRLRICRL